MKRLLPVIIALAILVSTFMVLPKTSDNEKDPDLLAQQINECIANMKESGMLDELDRKWISEYDRGNVEADKSGITGENGTIIFACEASYEPLCFPGAGGDDDLQGIDVDFIYEFCRQYGYEPVLKTYEYGAMSAALKSRDVDVAVGVYAEEERAEELTFTDVFTGYEIIAAYNSNISSFSSISDLSGRVVALQTNAGYDEYLKEVVPDAEIKSFNDFSLIYPELDSGKVDAMLTESNTFPIEKIEHPEYVALDGSFGTIELRAAVVKLDDGAFFDELANSFSKTFIRDNRWQMFIEGVGVTLLITITSAILGTLLGLLIYLWVSHGKKAEEKFTSVFCWIMNSTPTVVLLMIFCYIIFGSFDMSNTIIAIITFTLHFACIFYEHIVTGVKAVGNGQVEAGRAQGFSQNQTFFRIIFPQAAEHFMPAYQGSIISLIQETSVVGYIAVMDLTKMSDLVRARTYEAFFPLIATACIYFLLIWILTSVVKVVAKKINKKNRKKENILKGIVVDK